VFDPAAHGVAIRDTGRSGKMPADERPGAGARHELELATRRIVRRERHEVTRQISMTSRKERVVALQLRYVARRLAACQPVRLIRIRPGGGPIEIYVLAANYDERAFIRLSGWVR
jgi:hypothetical protein